MLIIFLPSFEVSSWPGKLTRSSVIMGHPFGSFIVIVRHFHIQAPTPFPSHHHLNLRSPASKRYSTRLCRRHLKNREACITNFVFCSKFLIITLDYTAPRYTHAGVVQCYEILYMFILRVASSDIGENMVTKYSHRSFACQHLFLHW